MKHFIVFVLANSADPDEMQHNDVFQTTCLPVSKMKGLKLAKLPYMYISAVVKIQNQFLI